MSPNKTYLTGRWLLFALLFSTTIVSTAEIPMLETKEVDFFDKAKQRPVKVKFWYQAGAEVCDAQICLQEKQKVNRVAVISHGAFGSPHEMNWLAYPLASQGWVVIGVAHYGESWVYGKKSIDPSTPMRFWQRPEEVSFILDSLAKKTLFNVQLETDSVVMLGHSSGGFTALAMVGAHLEAGKSQNYCQSERSKGDLGCRYGSQTRAQPLTETQIKTIEAYQESMQDSRIVSAVALDPAIGHASNEESLSNIKVPTLIIGSVDNDFLPYDIHAKYYAAHIPKAQLIGLAQGAGHFVYIDSCDSERKAQGVPLCIDREGVDRKALQQQILSYVFTFIYNQGL